MFDPSLEAYVLVIIIAAIVFWPLSLLASKLFKQTRSVILVSLIGSLVVAPILYVGLMGAIIFSIYSYPSRNFTVEAWHAAGWRHEFGDNIPPTRFEYSADLIAKKLLIGKTKEEVIAILGEGHETNNRISYDLGFVPGHGIDPDFLEVYFENGVVVKVEQRRS